MKYSDIHLICSLSGGVNSAVATQRCIDTFGLERTSIVFADTLWEDDDNYRFIYELCQRWGKLTVLMDGRNPLQVADDRRLIPNQNIAPCTFELKIKQIISYVETIKAQGKFPIMVLGMNQRDAKKGRLIAPVRNWTSIGAGVCYPLLWNPIVDEKAVIKSWGLALPRMYDMGYPHANCGGRCIKQGQGDMRRTLVFFPGRFSEIATWESDKRADPHFEPYSIVRKTVDGKKISYPLVQIREDYLKAITPAQKAALRLEDDLAGCSTECGVSWQNDADGYDPVKVAKAILETKRFNEDNPWKGRSQK